jgi:hypothetical protein
MMKMALRMPDTLINYQPDLMKRNGILFTTVLSMQLDETDKYRAGEGEAMKSDLKTGFLQLKPAFLQLTSLKEPGLIILVTGCSRI